MGRGPVYESMTFASMDQFRQLWEESKRGGMPILFNVFNNDYGMGGQTRGETMGYDFLARLGSGITPTQMYAERIDGFNPLAVIDAMRRKKDLLLNGDGRPCWTWLPTGSAVTLPPTPTPTVPTTRSTPGKKWIPS